MYIYIKKYLKYFYIKRYLFYSKCNYKEIQFANLIEILKLCICYWRVDLVILFMKIYIVQSDVQYFLKYL